MLIKNDTQFKQIPLVYSLSIKIRLKLEANGEVGMEVMFRLMRAIVSRVSLIREHKMYLSFCPKSLY